MGLTSPAFATKNSKHETNCGECLGRDLTPEIPKNPNDLFASLCEPRWDMRALWIAAAHTARFTLDPYVDKRNLAHRVGFCQKLGESAQNSSNIPKTRQSGFSTKRALGQCKFCDFQPNLPCFAPSVYTKKLWKSVGTNRNLYPLFASWRARIFM